MLLDPPECPHCNAILQTAASADGPYCWQCGRNMRMLHTATFPRNAPILTLPDTLIALDACPEQIALAVRNFGTGMHILTRAMLIEAATLGLCVDWLAPRMLSIKALRGYRDSSEPVRRAFLARTACSSPIGRRFIEEADKIEAEFTATCSRDGVTEQALTVRETAQRANDDLYEQQCEVIRRAAEYAHGVANALADALNLP